MAHPCTCGGMRSPNFWICCQGKQPPFKPSLRQIIATLCCMLRLYYIILQCLCVFFLSTSWPPKPSKTSLLASNEPFLLWVSHPWWRLGREPESFGSSVNNDYLTVTGDGYGDFGVHVAVGDFDRAPLLAEKESALLCVWAAACCQEFFLVVISHCNLEDNLQE